MTTKQDGGPAFPMPLGNESIDPSVAGMSLRDYFAAKAMAAIIMEPPWGEGSSAVVSRIGTGDTEEDRYATAAYRLADAMLLMRSK